MYKLRIVCAIWAAFAVSIGAAPSPSPFAAQEPASSQQAKPQEAQPTQEPKPGEKDTNPVEIKPEIPPVAAPIDPKSYVIGAEDVVAIRVWRENELSGLYVVRPDGKISMPLAGEIDAAGATPELLKQRVVTALLESMTRPEVMVEIRQVNSKKFYITGEVNRPGSYNLVTPVSILEALSNAGGLREFASAKKIVIMRKGERLKFNYKEVIKGKNMEQNIQLQPGDHIIIP